MTLTNPTPKLAELRDELDQLATQNTSGRRARRAATTDPAPEGSTPSGNGVLADPVHEPNGYSPQRRKWLSRIGFYVPTAHGAPSTTRQSELLNTGMLSAPTSVEGVLIGDDTLTLTMVAWDPVTAYYLGLVDSPNVVVLGDVGSGKSSLLKTCYLLRPMILKDIRFVVIDKKPNGTAAPGADGVEALVGEYHQVAEAADVTPIRFEIGGGGSCINILDPDLLPDDAKGVGTLGILTRACELLEGGQPLTALQRKALRDTLRRVRTAHAAAGTVPVLQDLIDALYQGDVPTGTRLRPNASDALYMASVHVAAVLEQLVEEMPGLFDGPTSEDVRFDDKLTVFDINALPEEGAALNIVVMLINVWVLGSLRQLRRQGKEIVTYFLVDEGWYLVGGPMGKVIRSNAKLSRGLGLVNIVGLHHISDIPADDPAIAFVKEAGTMHLYRQARSDDAEMVERIANLQPGAASLLQTLSKGEHLLKAGLKPEIRVRHLRSRVETTLTNTDGGLTGGRERKAA
ncbi:ATP/GTP-binding protein [Leifsonia aquatica]|uniref:ATP/GTP-binding protein n=1 Tax=Leifsonia aquatica TaxID=144185 RepID=UPI003850AD09